MTNKKIYDKICVIVAQYPSQFCLSESGPKNPPNGTSMKFLVFGFERPVWGGCWELRFGGSFQWHGNINPFSAEACDCGMKTFFGISLRHRGKPVLRLVVFLTNAVGSVASLEWAVRIDEQPRLCSVRAGSGIAS